MRKVYFRADASVAIGYGHFIRSLALADMLKDDFNCIFFTCHPTPYQVSEMEKVCSFITLQEETHYGKFLSYLQGDEIAVLDNYFFDTGYQRKIKAKGCKLVCIDDMHDKYYVADIVVNHSLLRKPKSFSKETYTKLCLGEQYALLRKPFISNHNLTIKRNDHIVVCIGGSDPLHIIDKIVDIILERFPDKLIHVIVGDTVKTKYEGHCSVTLHRGIPAEEVAGLFCKSGLAIVSASSVLLEAYFCGIPVMVGWLADNQKEIYEYIEKNDLFVTIGYLPELSAEKIKKGANLNNNKISDCNIKNNYLTLFKSL